MVHFDGLDVTKEIIFLLGIPDELAKRGIATLLVDNPGVGESLRLKGLHNGPDAEAPAKAAVDFLQSAPGVDRDRIGMMALSLGGYHAPRAAAFEPRFKCCVAWGANYDWGETQRRRYEAKEQRLPVPHYWSMSAGYSANLGRGSHRGLGEIVAKGILHQIKCPILVAMARTIGYSAEPGQATNRRLCLKPKSRALCAYARRWRRGALRHRQCGADPRGDDRLDRRNAGRPYRAAIGYQSCLD